MSINLKNCFSSHNVHLSFQVCSTTTVSRAPVLSRRDLFPANSAGLTKRFPMSARNRRKTCARLSPFQHTICIAPWKVFYGAESPDCRSALFYYPSRDRSGGSSVIGYHLPQSVSVFVRELFRRSADQLVVAQPGANARRWEHVRYGDLRLYERLKMLPLLRQVRECGCDARLKLCYRVRVIAPAHLAFASRENERLLGSEASFHRCFPHPLSKFLARKQQVSFGSGF